MPVDPKRVQSVFLAAVEATDPAARAAALDRECGADVELRQRVAALLHAHDHPASFLKKPAGHSDIPVNSQPGARPGEGGEQATGAAVEGPGTRVGPYKLIEQIGEGGFGVVFMAEQQHPVRRKVALKVLKPGMDTKHVVA